MALLRLLAHQGFCRSRLYYTILYTHAALKGTTAKEEMNNFRSTNARLKRPISPHLTIYKWSLPMMMSITHRVIGVDLSEAIPAFVLAALILPGNYPNYLDSIHSLSIGPFLIGMAKFGIVFPMSYHTYNGIWHLWWDIGKGFQIFEVVVY